MAFNTNNVDFTKALYTTFNTHQSSMPENRRVGILQLAQLVFERCEETRGKIELVIIPRDDDSGRYDVVYEAVEDIEALYTLPLVTQPLKITIDAGTTQTGVELTHFLISCGLIPRDYYDDDSGETDVIGFIDDVMCDWLYNNTPAELPIDAPGIADCIDDESDYSSDKEMMICHECATQVSLLDSDSDLD